MTRSASAARDKSNTQQVWNHYSDYALMTMRVRMPDGTTVVGYDVDVEKVLLLSVSLAALYSAVYSRPDVIEGVLKVDGYSHHGLKHVKCGLNVRGLGYSEQNRNNVFPLVIVNMAESPETYQTMFSRFKPMLSRVR